LGQHNIDRAAVGTAAELLLPPRMANTHRFDVVICLNLRLQLRESARLSNHHVVVALEVACSAVEISYNRRMPNMQMTDVI